MQFKALPIEGAFLIELELAEDARGFFARVFCAEAFAERGLKTDFEQRSLSRNRRRGTLRGLHYQAAPHEETKIVRCTRGAAFDVIVDLREASPTYLRWHAEELTAENGAGIYIPPGCAHGFQTLIDETDIYYEITPAYVPEAARGIRYDDPDLGIFWPLADAVISDRDLQMPRVAKVDVRDQ
jgi:dTDP-4-dehydrorhamnose 3,5-epimerase